MPEAVLGFRQGKVDVEVGKDQSLQDLGGGAEERDGAVGAEEFAGLVGFGDGDDVGVFPDGRDAGIIEGVVEEVGEEVEAPWARML